jgi:hypothetical protein
MPLLKAVIAKLDDVEEAFRGLYVEKNGKFEVQVEGLKTQGDIDRLSTANIAEREAHRATRQSLKESADRLILYGDVTPEQVTANAEQLATLQAAGTPELAKNFEKIVNDRVEANLVNRVKTATDKLVKTNTDLTTALGTAEKSNADFSTRIVQRTIDDSVRAAAITAKIIPEAVADTLIIARGTFKIVEGKVQTEEGQTPEQWIEARKEVSKHWWPDARGAGAHGSDGLGAEHKDNPFMHANWNLTSQSRLVQANPGKAAQMAEQAGTKIGGLRPPAPAK